MTSHDALDIEVKFLEEFNEYQNVGLRCPCGTKEVFNVNIPVNDTDESFQTGDLPIKEEIQRHYVRILQRLVRADFK